MEPATVRDRLGSRRDLATALLFVLGVNAVGAAPALAFELDASWVDRPSWYPPAAVFTLAWTVVFTLLGIALYLVYRRGTGRRDVRLALGAFAGQFVLNLAWTPVFFELRRPDLGFAVIVALWLAVAATAGTFGRVDRRAGALLVPYLAWLTFAAALNYAIWAG